MSQPKLKRIQNFLKLFPNFKTKHFTFSLMKCQILNNQFRFISMNFLLALLCSNHFFQCFFIQVSFLRYQFFIKPFIFLCSGRNEASAYLQDHRIKASSATQNQGQTTLEHCLTNRKGPHLTPEAAMCSLFKERSIF